jgi:hypothetical protein
MPDGTDTKPTVEVIDTRTLRLDLGAGQHPKAGFRGVDLYTGDERVDLLSFPWPWADASVDEARSSHFVEHIPMCYVDKKNKHHHVGGPGRKDLFFAFFDELWRVLKPGAQVEIVVPYCQSRRAFQDPTHRRFIPEETFNYLNRAWREANGLDHYGPDCDFIGVSCTKITDPVEGSRHPEVQADRAQGRWNMVSDIVVVLRKA